MAHRRHRDSYIEEQVRLCMYGFETAHTLFKWNHNNNLQTTASLANQYDRFCLWAHDSNVPDGVLDHRLKHSSDLRQCLTELLSDLKEQLTPIPISKSRTILSSDILEEITNIIDNLIRLEPALESPAPLDRYPSLAKKLHTPLASMIKSLDALTLNQDKGKDVSLGRDSNKTKYVQRIEAIIQDDPALMLFYQPKSPFVEEIARKAALLANDPQTDLGKGDLLAKLIQVSLYHHVIYCDDRQRLIGQKDSWQKQIRLIDRIAHVTNRISPNERGVTLCLSGSKKDGCTEITYGEVRSILNQSRRPSKETADVRIQIQSAIITPLVYERKALGSFDRPLLVSMIIDSRDMDGSCGGDFQAMSRCQDWLEANGYPCGSVKFVIWPLGPDGPITSPWYITWKTMTDEEHYSPVDFVKVDHPDITNSDDLGSYNDRDLDRWVIEILHSSMEKLKK